MCKNPRILSNHSDLAFQREVTVEVHTTDRYGRLVGEVRLPDGRSLN